jgi:hypothetical protein
MTQPMDSDWGQIYFYITGQSYKRWNKGEISAKITVNPISDYQIVEALVVVKAILMFS